jgi:hypothetical protein
MDGDKLNTGGGKQISSLVCEVETVQLYWEGEYQNKYLRIVTSTTLGKSVKGLKH